MPLSGRLNDLHNETLPGKKALIVTSNGTSAKKYGYLARVKKELDAAVGKKTAPNPAIPIVCIPTSARTASEVDIASVITNEKNRKRPKSSSRPYFPRSLSSIVI